MSRAMKDSGVEWIGEIPEDWDVKRLKHVAKIQTGNTPTKTDEQYYSTNGIDWIKSDNLLGTKGISESKEKLSTEGEKTARIAAPYSTLVCCIGTVGKIGYTIKPVAYNQQINAVTFNSANVYWKYGMYHLSVQQEQQQYFQNGNVLKILNTDNQKKVSLPVPPLSEQQKIADFLDEKVVHIDSLVSQTKESIEAFKAYKQALITETVTKGLNPDVKMKDSGIEWIGEIPEHWDAWKLKQLFEIKKIIAGKLGYDILSITQNGLKIKDISSNEGQISADYSKYQIVDIGDFAMNHMDLLTGWVDCATFSGVTSPDYRVFKSRNPQTVYNDYYKYVFQMSYSNKIFYGLGQGVSNLGRWRLPTNNFLNFGIPHPHMNEQQQIAEFLDDKTAHIDALIADKEKMVKELQEYKKSLIYEYVTGKKEV